jgi:hypothetical protein
MTGLLCLQQGNLDNIPAEEIAHAHRHYAEEYGQK